MTHTRNSAQGGNGCSAACHARTWAFAATSFGFAWTARVWARLARVALLFAALGWAPSATAEDSLVKLTEIAPGVHVFIGPHGEASPKNLGGFSNVGAIIGNQSVAIVDTGGSLRFGQALRAAVSAITTLPISHVINTHVHPDHILGNAAFDDDGVQFVGHHKLTRAMAQRARFYLDNFKTLIGDAFEGTRLVPPDVEVEAAMTINLGDRTLHLVAHPTAHTDNDLTVLDAATGTLFTGDLLFMERLPVVDGSLPGWIRLNAALQARMDGAWANIKRVVPGHGPASAPWPAAFDNQQRYLEVLITGTRAAVADNIGIQRAVEVVGGEESKHWLLFEDNHPRNVTSSYAELEWE